jgi:hypothetical protein
MKAAKQFYVLAGMALCLLAACSGPEQFKAVERICVPEMTKAEVMQTAEDVLGQMYFDIDKADVNSGFIRTKPLQGAQFFELWRSDNVGARNSAEANLQSIRRTVELQINEENVEEGNKLCIRCDAKTQRLNMPEREVTSSARAYEMYSKSQRSMQKLSLEPEQRKQMLWVDLGPDKELATEILKRIEEAIAQKRKEPKL